MSKWIDLDLAERRVVLQSVEDKEKLQQVAAIEKDWWEFPGGKMEPGETPEEALIREIREELDTEISVDKFLYTIDWDYPKFHLTMHCFMSSLLNEALHLNEHEAARWLDKDEIHSVNWLPADEILLPMIVKELESADNQQKA